MATKTWKIGEYCKGGIITVETDKNNVIIIGKEWDHSKGTRRSSDQSNAQEFTRLKIPIKSPEAYNAIQLYLNELTTIGYSDEIFEWIESKVPEDQRSHW